MSKPNLSLSIFLAGAAAGWLMSLPAALQAQPEPAFSVVQTGGKSFRIPVMTGFKNARAVSTQWADLLERSTGNNRVLAGFLWDDDIALAQETRKIRAKRWLLVMVTKAIEGEDMNRSMFDEVVKDVDQQPTLSPTPQEVTARLKAAGPGFKGVDIKGMTWGGRVFRTPNAAGYLMLARMNAAWGEEISVVAGMAILHMQNRIVNLYVYRHRDDEAPDWVSATLKSWTAATLAAN